jgi:hypothetical protein
MEAELENVRIERAELERRLDHVCRREAHLERGLRKVVAAVHSVSDTALAPRSRTPVRELSGTNEAIVDFLEKSGPARPAEIAAHTGLPPTHVNVYLGRLKNWVVKVDRGLYDHIGRAGPAGGDRDA